MYAVVSFGPNDDDENIEIAIVRNDWFTDDDKVEVKFPPKNHYRKALLEIPDPEKVLKWGVFECTVMKDDFSKYNVQCTGCAGHISEQSISS